jgi:hypothetical protein
MNNNNYDEHEYEYEHENEYNVQRYLLRYDLELASYNNSYNSYTNYSIRNKFNKIYYKFFCFQLLKMNSILYYLKQGIKHPTLMKLCWISSIFLNNNHHMKPSLLISQIGCQNQYKLLKKNATFNIDYIYEESAYAINLMMFMNVAYVAFYRNKISFLPPEIWFLISRNYATTFKIPTRIPFTINNRTDFYLEYLLFNILYYKKKTIKRLIIDEKDYDYLDYLYNDYIGETILINHRYKHALNDYIKINQKLHNNNLFYNIITDNIENLFP